MDVGRIVKAAVFLIAGIGIVGGSVIGYYALMGWWAFADFDNGAFDVRAFSLAVDNADRPHMVYAQDNETGCCGIYYAYVDDSGDLNRELIADSSDSFSLSRDSIAIDGNNGIHIAYTSLSLLFYAHGTEAGLSVSPVEEGLEIGADTFGGPSIDVDSQGRPWIVYGDGRGVRYAYRYQQDGIWRWATGSVTSELSPWVSIDLDRNDVPNILYFNQDSGSLQLGRRNGASWSLEDIPSDADEQIEVSSLRLDNDDVPHFVYMSSPVSDIKHYVSKQGGEWISDDVSTAPTILIDFEINKHGDPHILHSNRFHDIWLQHLYRYTTAWDVDDILEESLPGVHRGISRAAEIAMRSDDRPVVLFRTWDEEESRSRLFIATRRTPPPLILRYLVQ